MAQGLKIYNDAGTASTTLDLGNPVVDRTIAIDTMLSDIALKANTADLKEIGVGQTWQDVTASRVLGATYTNTTGKPIEVIVSAYHNGTNSRVSVYVGAVHVSYAGDDGTLKQFFTSQTFCVPNGATYTVNATAGTSLSRWSELR